MSCERCESRLGPLLYGELEPEEAAEVREHLTSCARCRREHAAMVKARETLEHLAVPSAEATDPARIRRLAVRRRISMVPRGLAAAVLLVLALLGALSLARTELRLEDGGFVLRMSWRPPADGSPAPAPIAAGEETIEDLDRRFARLEELQDAKLLALALSVDVSREQLEEQVRRRLHEFEAATAQELMLAHSAVGELASLVVR